MDNRQCFCPYCGQLIEDDSKFCPFCGNSFVTVSDKFYLKDSEESFFNKHHLFSCDGRRGRIEYIKVYLFWFLILSIPIELLNIVVAFLSDYNLVISFIFWFVFAFLFMFPSVCNMAKRMHDLGYSTSYAIIYNFILLVLVFIIDFTKPLAYKSNFILFGRIIITFVFMIPFYMLFYKKGTDGPNQYGEDPLS